MRTTVFNRTATRGTAIALALVASLALAACGEEDGADEPTSSSTGSASEMEQASIVEVEDPWVRATKGSEDESMSAAFMLLDNGGDMDVEIVGASSEVAETTELHEMSEVDGEMAMSAIESIEIRPDRGQILQPGGTHIMLMGLTEELVAGDEVSVTLEFGDGSRLEVLAPVKPFTEETPHYHAPGTGEHEH